MSRLETGGTDYRTKRSSAFVVGYLLGNGPYAVKELLEIN